MCYRGGMSEELGLRERKKRQTRERIANAAWELFLDHGFEGVSVAAIARRADVSEATVFNYFPTKEDLVFHRMTDFEERMLEAVRARPAGDTVAVAFGRFVLDPRGLVGSDDPRADADLGAALRIVTASPALLARERELLERYAGRLAPQIADERGLPADSIEAATAAYALVGLHWALVHDVRRRVLAGEPRAAVADVVRVHGTSALRLLLEGLA